MFALTNFIDWRCMEQWSIPPMAAIRFRQSFVGQKVIANFEDRTELWRNGKGRLLVASDMNRDNHGFREMYRRVGGRIGGK
jgi:hypothetical protein